MQAAFGRQSWRSTATTIRARQPHDHRAEQVIHAAGSEIEVIWLQTAVTAHEMCSSGSSKLRCSWPFLIGSPRGFARPNRRDENHPGAPG